MQLSLTTRPPTLKFAPKCGQYESIRYTFPVSDRSSVSCCPAANRLSLLMIDEKVIKNKN